MELQTALTQTLYAQLLDEPLSYKVIMFEDVVVGSSYVNTSNGRRYLYWQVRLTNGTFRRKTLEPETEENHALVQRLIEHKRDIDEAIGKRPV